MEADGLTGARVAAARKDAGLSQRALAAELGVTLRTVQNYESGRIIPYRHLQSLSTLLGRSAAWFLTGREPLAGDLVAAARGQRARLTHNMDRLRALIRELNDRGAVQAALLAEPRSSGRPQGR